MSKEPEIDRLLKATADFESEQVLSQQEIEILQGPRNTPRLEVKRLPPRVTRCTTHSHACPCREYRLAKMEQALRIIQTWAACFDSRIESADKAMDDIENKCREVLEQL